MSSANSGERAEHGRREDDDEPDRREDAGHGGARQRVGQGGGQPPARPRAGARAAHRPDAGREHDGGGEVRGPERARERRRDEARVAAVGPDRLEDRLEEDDHAGQRERADRERQERGSARGHARNTPRRRGGYRGWTGVRRRGRGTPRVSGAVPVSAPRVVGVLGAGTMGAGIAQLAAAAARARSCTTRTATRSSAGWRGRASGSTRRGARLEPAARARRAWPRPTS